jgi:hypothetical protein
MSQIILTGRLTYEPGKNSDDLADMVKVSKREV